MFYIPTKQVADLVFCVSLPSSFWEVDRTPCYKTFAQASQLDE